MNGLSQISNELPADVGRISLPDDPPTLKARDDKPQVYSTSFPTIVDITSPTATSAAIIASSIPQRVRPPRDCASGHASPTGISATAVVSSSLSNMGGQSVSTIV